MEILRKVQLLLTLTLLSFAAIAADQGNNDDGTDDGSDSVYFKNCDGSLVQATSVSILCDSPNTYYYGSNAYRSSPYCNYGDKATIAVCFEVTEDLSETLGEMYLTLGVYSGSSSYDELLYSILSGQVCNGLVGDATCTYAGNYCFKVTKTLDTPSDGTDSDFVPAITMAFSSYADEGYDLGSVNRNCMNDNYGQYDPWVSGDPTAVKNYRSGKFLKNYGVLLGVIACVVLFGIFTVMRSTPEKNLPVMDVQAKMDLLRSARTGA
mmetsp:Transcript_1976/g.5458  ORF Transcript_1976/g.5458 Transcript_1976/m.5458 type:complete len:265 (+) Transcript_1976:102-896(+)